MTSRLAPEAIMHASRREGMRLAREIPLRRLGEIS